MGDMSGATWTMRTHAATLPTMQRQFLSVMVIVGLVGSGCTADKADGGGDTGGGDTGGDTTGLTTGLDSSSSFDVDSTGSSGPAETTEGGIDVPNPPTSLDEAIQIYGAAWNEADPERRLALLELAWAEDGHYSDPMAEAIGRQELSDEIDRFQGLFPGSTLSLGGEVNTFADRFRFDWMIDGSLELPGMDAGIIGADFRIKRIRGFFGPLPTEGEPSEQLAAYLAAWNEPDAALRADLLTTAVTDEFVYRDPDGERVGRDSVSAHMAAVQGLLGAPVALASAPDVYADAMRYAWVFGDSDAPVFSGLDVVEVAVDGRLTSVTGFFDR